MDIENYEANQDIPIIHELPSIVFSFTTLDPRPISAATDANNKVFQNPVGVLGIEVTVPTLAERCNLGNIDPQHSENKDQAAIEAALVAELPPTDATLATVRADVDSVGVMAILALRRKGKALDGNEGLQERVRQIAESDRFARGGWPGKRPLPTADNPWSDSSGAAVDGNKTLAGIASAIADFKLPLDQRVGLMETWLETGDEPEEYRKKSEAERMDMVRALETGEIQVSTTYDGRIAIVKSKHTAAMSVGYTQAPVVVAQNPELPGQDGSKYNKFTIAQFEGGYVDMNAVLKELNQREEGWGGSANIIGSPQGTSSQISTEEVTQIVARHTL